MRHSVTRAAAGLLLTLAAPTLMVCGDDDQGSAAAATEEEWVGLFCDAVGEFNEALVPSVVDDDGAATLDALPEASHAFMARLDAVEPPGAFQPMHEFVVDLYETAASQDTSTMAAATKEDALAAYFSGPAASVAYPDLAPDVMERLGRLAAEEPGCGPAPFGVPGD